MSTSVLTNTVPLIFSLLEHSFFGRCLITIIINFSNIVVDILIVGFAPDFMIRILMASGFLISFFYIYERTMKTILH